MTASSRSAVQPIEWGLMAAASALLVAVVASGLWKLPWIEVFGFITAGSCVWLMAREHIATWPIGIASNLAYGVLFFDSRLYADMSLQAVFLGLSVAGWWNWSQARSGGAMAISSISRTERWLLLPWVFGATFTIREILLVANGAAPLLDALTTALSLAAQYLASRKRAENWLLWIVADLIYIPLYLSRGLPLTALLYAAFLVMCVVGWRQWRRELAA